MKTFRHLFEAFFVYIIFYTFKLMPIDTASFVGGFIGRKIGVFVKASKIARSNLTLCFPELSEDEKSEIITKMWDNLGRMAGEFPHISALSDKEFNKRIKIHNFPKTPPKCGLMVSAHFGNFELPARMAQHKGLKIHLVHRPANNPFVNRLINAQRERCGAVMFKKGKIGVKQMLELARNKNGVIGMLVDQKTNTGIDVPFFGMPAKTTPFPANLVLRYDVPLICMKINRTKGAYFDVQIYDPLPIKKGMSAEQIMTKIHAEFEKWIREQPEQWFWVHRRWGKF